MGVGGLGGVDDIVLGSFNIAVGNIVLAGA